MKKTISYLDQLQFDQGLLNKWYSKYMTQVRLVMLLILSIVAIGIFGYLNLPRRLNPEVKLPIVVISTVLPGASPEDIESLVTIPIEDKVSTIEDIDTLVSTSAENSSTVTLQFKSGVDPDKARDKVQSAVDSVNDLPTDALDSNVIKLDFENQPIWNFAVITEHDYASLMRFTTNLKDRIEALPVVDRVAVSGFDEQDIEVQILPEKIREYGITPIQLSQIIQKAASSYPAGSVQTDVSSFAITIDRDLVTLDDVRNLRVGSAGQDLMLGNIAAIGYKSKPGQAITYYSSKEHGRKPAVQFFIYKTANTNIDDAEEVVQKEVDTVLSQSNKFTLINITNYADEVTKQFNELTQDFLFTVALVFVLLLVFLGLKQAIISSFTVPLTFLSAFAIINALGLSLNFLTMFAFLIALGLLIDDTIVTVAAMTRYFATGKFTPTETGVLVWKDFIVPLWSTTITTIWAFVPLLLATGIIGEFIKSIPIVVTATMISSTTIAVFITLPLMIIFLKPVFPRRVKILLSIVGLLIVVATPALFLPKNVLLPIVLLAFVILVAVVIRTRSSLLGSFSNFIRTKKYLNRVPEFTRKMTNQGILDIEKVSHVYMRLIDRIIMSKHGKRNTIIAIVVFALSAYLLVPLGFVKNEFFPKQDSDILYVSVEMPSGTNIETLNTEAESLLERIKDTEETEFVIAESGAGFSGDMGRSSAGSGLLFTLHLTPHEERNIPSYDLAQILRKKLADYDKGKVVVQEVSGGPPAGSDIQVSLLGEESSVLDSYANKVVAFLEKEPGVTNVNKSIKPGISKIVFKPDQSKLSTYGLTVDAIALWMRTYASGFSLDKIKFEGKEKEIVLRFYDETQTVESLGSVNIPTQSGSVPLITLGDLSLEPNPTIITREDKKRTITVSAALVAGYNLQDKNTALTNFMNNELDLVSGYSWKTGGANEENQKSINSIMQAMLVSFLLILITMVLEFRSFRQTFIALMIIPLSIAGVFYVFALTHTPLSFPALIGILALFGIVVTHAIVVIEKINDNLREKLPLRDAIVDAAGNRLEPVLLTSLATIAGLIPITLSDPLWRGLGGAIIAGLLFSGAIKLFFVPVMYYLLFKGEATDTNKEIFTSTK